MTKATIAGGALALVLLALVALVVNNAFDTTHDQKAEPVALVSPAAAISTEERASEAEQGFLFGRVTTEDGTIYEGRLRFGSHEEAFWGDSFNGFKDKNPWEAQAPSDQLRKSHPLQIFGVKVFRWQQQIDLTRPFMMRFGDITRIEADGRDLRVTLKSGAVFHLDRYGADDLNDGLRVWDSKRGVVNLDEAPIRRIDLLPTGRLDTAPGRLHGTVRTRGGIFTGFIQWGREAGVSSDELAGHAADGERRLRFDTIRAIVRDSSNNAQVTLLDGKEVVISHTGDIGASNRGIYVDNRRYGRVLISWNAFERVDFSPGSSSPAYNDFPKGSPLIGEVTTRDGRRLTGRLVYDLDESETTETLDAPSQGVDYSIPFGLIASIALPEERGDRQAKVTLHSGEVLQLDLAGDLGDRNPGILIFGSGSKRPEFVRWTDVRQLRFDRPPAMYPPIEGP